MGVIDRVKHFFQHDLWRKDIKTGSRLKAYGIEVLRVLHLVLAEKNDLYKLRASALTYATLMSVVPFLVIIFSIGKAIGFTKAEDTVLNAIVDLPPEIQDFVRNILDIVQGINPAALGAIGGIIFLIIILRLLNSIEESFNQIWGVKASRGMSYKIRNYLSVLVVVPALMLVANAGSAMIQAFMNQVTWVGPIVSFCIQVAPVFVLSLAFVAIFMFLPNTKVEFKSAMIGGFVSASCILVLQYLTLEFSVSLFSKYAIYGSFASIPIFLFWLHLNWSILLFGAELAFAIQNRETYAEEQSFMQASVISKIWVAFSVMQGAVSVFEGKQSMLDVQGYARKRHIPVRLVHEVVGVLVKAELLAEVRADGKELCVVLLHAPEKISARMIYEVMVQDGASPEDFGLLALEGALDGSIDEISVRSFFKEVS